jgi:two-component sensor histidine kinase
VISRAQAFGRYLSAQAEFIGTGEHDPVPKGDFIDRLARFSEGTPRYSARAALIAALCFLAATLVRLGFDLIGTDIRFATYFPAIIASGLLAGVPSALLVTFAATVTTWLFFMPHSVWASRTPELISALLIWSISATALIIFAHICRVVLRRLRRRERELELIARELEHRGRNTYAVIEAIVYRTLEGQEARANAILGRIRSLKYANDLIATAGPNSVFIKSLLLYEFAPFDESRFMVDGPDIELGAQGARHLVLIIHELVTNSAKYGALSQPSGRVCVNWKQGSSVSLEWKELGGPPAKEPSRKGFGSKLIMECAKALGGKITSEFRADGFFCSLSFKLHNQL